MMIVIVNYELCYRVSACLRILVARAHLHTRFRKRRLTSGDASESSLVAAHCQRIFALCGSLPTVIVKTALAEIAATAVIATETVAALAVTVISVTAVETSAT